MLNSDKFQTSYLNISLTTGSPPVAILRARGDLPVRQPSSKPEAVSAICSFVIKVIARTS